MEKMNKRVRTGMLVLLLGLTGAYLIPGSRVAEADARGGASASAEGGMPQRSASAADSLLLTEKSTLDDFRAYAGANNPELRAARLRWQAALERIPQARALPDPQLGYRFEDMGGGFGSWEHRLEASQMFPWFGKRDLMGDREGIMADIEEQMYQEMKLRLSTMVTGAYTEYYFLSREITVTEENLKLLSYLERVAQSRYTAGKGSQSDVIKAQVEMGVLEERIQSLRDMLRPTAAKLNAALNRPGDAPLPAPSGLPDVDITRDETRLASWLKEHNPSLKAASFQTQSSDKAVELARKEYYPDIMLGIGVGTGKDSIAGAMGSRRNSFMGMFSLNIPLWGRKNRAAVNEAQEIRRSSEQARNNRENELAAELQEALYRWRDSERKVRLYRDSLLPKARQSLAVSQRAFEAGNAGFLDLVDAQRMLLELELSLERALSDRVQSHAVIVQLTGRERLTDD
ncbi:MAG: TolC family protein [Candidatus Latescibacterota bacterium]